METCTWAHLNRISSAYNGACPSLAAFYTRKLIATYQSCVERVDKDRIVCLSCGHDRRSERTRVRIAPKMKLRRAHERCAARPSARRRPGGFWAHLAARCEQRLLRASRVGCLACGQVARVPLGRQAAAAAQPRFTPSSGDAAKSTGLRKKKKKSKTATDSSCSPAAAGAASTPDARAPASALSSTPLGRSALLSPLTSAGGDTGGSGKKKRKDYHRQLSKILTSDKARADKSTSGGGLLSFLQSL